jgi:hypothetical protein
MKMNTVIKLHECESRRRGQQQTKLRAFEGPNVRMNGRSRSSRGDVTGVQKLKAGLLKQPFKAKLEVVTMAALSLPCFEYGAEITSEEVAMAT